jgi:CheY-like chemotaxis protein
MSKLNIAPFNLALIIDDDPVDRYIIDRMLNNYNFATRILQYSSAPEALQYLNDNLSRQELIPQTIFVDIYMPEMTGFQFLESYDRFPDSLKQSCKVCMVSSTCDERDINKIRSHPLAFDFFEKPITVSHLEKLISAKHEQGG